jgi:hypothetical protein
MPTTPTPFADLPPTAAEHFKLYYFAAVLHVVEQAAQSFTSYDDVFTQYVFLVGYHEELARRGLEGVEPDRRAAWWRDAVLAWEEGVAAHLPLRALRDSSGLGHEALTLLMSVGLTEEDARFGLLFESAQAAPGQHRPTLGLFNAWWREPVDRGEVRSCLRRLQALGLVSVVNPDAPRIEWALQVPAPVWDAIRGEAHEAITPWATYREPAALADTSSLIVAESLRQPLATIPALLASGEARALLIRGPRHNGRKTVLGAVARAMGRGLLEVRGLTKPDDERWRLVGALATLLHALPAIVLDLAPGETVELPWPEGYRGPIGVILGRQGGVSGAGAERALTLTLDTPDSALRGRHWREGLGGAEVVDFDAVRDRYRMTSGNVRRCAGLARAHAALEGRAAVTPGDVRGASRALNRQALETLAVWLPAAGSWGELAVAPETARELDDLESRCRHRERLHEFVGEAMRAQGNPGVRALFCGPSGTGKTLAARLLASALEMDLYRLDLSTVVNKYIGETEKNLNQIFTRAEELDVILLIDEGDAILTQRTSVQTSNDRYANLETNFLLQRLESYEGVLIVTTNAADRIDGAFQRRMDVVVDFRPPDAAERWAIWEAHLTAGHAVGPAFLREVAGRCALTGGQIRNAVLHASLLALRNGGRVTAAYLDSSVRREYEKAGGVCPLPRRFPT